MNYEKIYYDIINNRLKNPYDGYTENHHIIPRSLSGADDDSNLVKLNAREHFICHLLLTKIHDFRTTAGKKMVKAFMMMLCCKSKNQDRYISSKEFKILREKFSITQRELQYGEGNSQYGTRWKWIHNDVTGKIKKIKPEDNIPIGWEYGLTFNLRQIELKEQQSKQEKLRKKQMHKQHLSEYYEIYKSVGFDEFVKITGYNKSMPNLVQTFKRHVDNFVPQNGKKR